MVFDVPADARPRDHLWLAVPIEEATLWIDFIAADPLELTLSFDLPARLGEGQALSGTAAIASNLEETSDIRFATKGADGVRIAPSSAELRVGAYKRHAESLTVGLPWQAGAYEVTVTAAVGQGEVTVTRKLKADWDYPLVLDPMDPAVPFTKGSRPRAATEETVGMTDMQQGTFELTRGVSGGVDRPCLFTHPPYGSARAGYTFGVYELELPAEYSAAFEFWMGMRDGLDATDGVTYKLTVIDAQGNETQVFSEHYDQTRWKQASADLSAFAGQRIRLKLIADCGPADDTTADHALWGDARIISRDERAKRLLVTEAE